MRLIDADDLIVMWLDYPDGEQQLKFVPYEFIEEAETIDAVQVVRCKDCRYGVDYYHEGDCYCSNPKWGLKYFGGSWKFYCADAERRTDEID